MNRTKRSKRFFSTAFKKEKVKLLDQGKTTVKALSELYDVSTRSVYTWRKKYSKLPQSERLVVEKISEEKKTLELMKHVRELEMALGRKQLELDYYKSIIEVISEEEGEDIEKKYKPRQ